MNVPSLSFEPPWALAISRWRWRQRVERAALAAMWRTLELASTLRTLTVHWPCGWSSYLSKDLGRWAVGLTVDSGAARIVQ